MINEVAYKYSANVYTGVITAYDTTGTLIADFTGYTAGFTAKSLLTDLDAAALIAETVTITAVLTGAYRFRINVNDQSAIADNSVLFCELWLRPSSGDKTIVDSGTLTILPTARIA
jgi:hypothetical protein